MTSVEMFVHSLWEGGMTHKTQRLYREKRKREGSREQREREKCTCIEVLLHSLIMMIVRLDVLGSLGVRVKTRMTHKETRKRKTETEGRRIAYAYHRQLHRPHRPGLLC